MLHQQVLQDEQKVASDETPHLDILVPPQEGPQDNQHLASCVHWAGIDEVLSRRQGEPELTFGDRCAKGSAGGTGPSQSACTIVHPRWEPYTQGNCTSCQRSVTEVSKWHRQDWSAGLLTPNPELLPHPRRPPSSRSKY